MGPVLYNCSPPGNMHVSRAGRRRPTCSIYSRLEGLMKLVVKPSQVLSFCVSSSIGASDLLFRRSQNF